MKTSCLHATRHLLDGAARIILADALILPTGILTVVFLTHRLGPATFGWLSVAPAIILWIEASINTVFHTATVKIVAAAKDWPELGATIVRLHFRASFVGTFFLWFLLPVIAKLLHEPKLAPFLYLFSVDIPLGRSFNATVLP